MSRSISIASLITNPGLRRARIRSLAARLALPPRHICVDNRNVSQHDERKRACGDECGYVTTPLGGSATTSQLRLSVFLHLLSWLSEIVGFGAQIPP
jgi:hypothetical protein